MPKAKPAIVITPEMDKAAIRHAIKTHCGIEAAYLELVNGGLAVANALRQAIVPGGALYPGIAALGKASQEFAEAHVSLSQAQPHSIARGQ